jgi:hypothetical protein
MKGIRWKVSKHILVFKPELSRFNLVSFTSTAGPRQHKIHNCPRVYNFFPNNSQINQRKFSALGTDTEPLGTTFPLANLLSSKLPALGSCWFLTWTRQCNRLITHLTHSVVLKDACRPWQSACIALGFGNTNINYFSHDYKLRWRMPIHIAKYVARNILCKQNHKHGANGILKFL